MMEISSGLESELEVSFYANSDFFWGQMREIRYGLEQELDVSVYAKPEIQHSEMREIRRNLLKDKLIKNNYKISTKKTSEITLEEINKMRIKLKHNNLY